MESFFFQHSVVKYCGISDLIRNAENEKKTVLDPQRTPKFHLDKYSGSSEVVTRKETRVVSQYNVGSHGRVVE